MAADSIRVEDYSIPDVGEQFQRLQEHLDDVCDVAKNAALLAAGTNVAPPVADWQLPLGIQFTQKS
ncbi:MAG TPA: hypothetical protein PK916_04575 [Bacteroidota bacterium]|nr:hypothetical protein [Bacteroidota bacterium]